MAKVGINREIGHLTEIADCRETCSLYQYKRIQEIIHIIYNVKGIYNVEVGYIINVRRIYIVWGGIYCEEDINTTINQDGLIITDLTASFSQWHIHSYSRWYIQ